MSRSPTLGRRTAAILRAVRGRRPAAISVAARPAARRRWTAAILLAALPASAPSVAADGPPAPQRAQVCLGCHGPAGIAANPAMPSISGQPRQFIATQLFQFREGRRQNPQMSPMAADLTNPELNELAAYFSAQKPDPPTHRGDPQKAERAKQLTTQLNCVSCHGQALTGQQHIPRIAGQQFEYVRTQLQGFKAATRADVDGLMTSAAQPLTEADIDAIADYVSSLGGG